MKESDIFMFVSMLLIVAGVIISSMGDAYSTGGAYLLAAIASAILALVAKS